MSGAMLKTTELHSVSCFLSEERGLMFHLTARVTTGPSIAFSVFGIGLDCQILAFGTYVSARWSKALTGSGCSQSSFCIQACPCLLLLVHTQLWQHLPQQAFQHAPSSLLAFSFAPHNSSSLALSSWWLFPSKLSSGCSSKHNLYVFKAINWKHTVQQYPD